MNTTFRTDQASRKRLEEWVEQYGDMVLKTCYLYLGDMAAAEDAMQDTFLKVWRGMSRFEGRNGSSVKTWIIRIAINTCKNHRNSAWRRRVDKRQSVETLPLAAPDVSEALQIVFLEVMQLPDKLKQTVLLYYYHGLNMEEIGGVLKISRSAVQHRLKKACALLKIQLEGSEFDEG